MKRAAYCWGPLKRKKNRGVLKNNSAKAIMVAFIRVHEKGCLLLETVGKEKKIREKKKEEIEKFVTDISRPFEKQ